MEVTEGFEVERVVDVDSVLLQDQVDYVTNLIIANSTLGANINGTNGSNPINVTVSYNVIHLRNGVEVDPPPSNERRLELILAEFTSNDLTEDLNVTSCNGTVVRITVTYASDSVELHQDMIDALRDAIFNLTHVLYGEEGQTAVQCSSNTEIVYGQNSTISSPPTPPAAPPAILAQTNLRPVAVGVGVGITGCFFCAFIFLFWLFKARRKCKTTQYSVEQKLFTNIDFENRRPVERARDDALRRANRPIPPWRITAQNTGARAGSSGAYQRVNVVKF